MRLNLIGAFIRNAPFGTEIAFEKGLRAINGIEIKTIDPGVDLSVQEFFKNPDATIVWKWLDEDKRDLLRFVPGVKIVFQPDDLHFVHIQQMMKSMRADCDYALVFNDDGASLAMDFRFGNEEKQSYLGSSPLVLTADPTLYRPLDDVERDIDVSFVGSLSYSDYHKSRMKMCELVDRTFPGIKKVFASNHDVHEINRIYNRSKIVLNHATDVGQSFGSGYGYQCRHFEVGMSGAKLLSNTVIDSDRIRCFEKFSDEKTLIDKIDFILNNPRLERAGTGKFYNEIMRFHNPLVRASEMLSIVSSFIRFDRLRSS